MLAFVICGVMAITVEKQNVWGQGMNLRVECLGWDPGSVPASPLWCWEEQRTDRVKPQVRAGQREATVCRPP